MEMIIHKPIIQVAPLPAGKVLVIHDAENPGVVITVPMTDEAARDVASRLTGIVVAGGPLPSMPFPLGNGGRN